MINNASGNNWLLKTEPSVWSWDQQVQNRTTIWDGVRNFQAQKYMKEMSVGDLCFFYHSTPDRCIVGIVRVIKPWYPDTSEPRFGNVDVETLCPLPCPVSLADIKSHPSLQSLPLVRQSRLSVMPIDLVSWKIIETMAGFKESNTFHVS